MDNMISREIVNTGRQREIDWAKACTILVMLVTHVYEQMSVVDTTIPPTGAFRLILEYIAGPIGAPLFMFCMGVGIMYSPKSTPEQMSKRGVRLLRNGYLLSFIKGTVPTAIALYLGFTAPWTLAESFLLVSILQFAGMAFFTIALMKKFNFSLKAMLATSLILSVLGGILAKLDFRDSWLQFVFGLFFDTNDVTTFPLFRWLYYPIFGMIFAYFLQRTTNKNKFYAKMFPVALVSTLAFTFIYMLSGNDLRVMFMLSGRVFYHQSLLHQLYATFVILTIMPVYYFLSVKLNLEPVRNAVDFLSRNIDVIYIIQWIIICYAQSLMICFGVPFVSIPGIFVAALIVLLLCVITINLLNYFEKRKEIA